MFSSNFWFLILGKWIDIGFGCWWLVGSGSEVLSCYLIYFLVSLYFRFLQGFHNKILEIFKFFQKSRVQILTILKFLQIYSIVKMYFLLLYYFFLQKWPIKEYESVNLCVKISLWQIFSAIQKKIFQTEKFMNSTRVQQKKNNKHCVISARTKEKNCKI